MRLSSPAARALSAVLLAAALMGARPPERASATPDALTGNLPTSGGFGLAVWGGGSLSALTGSAAGGGCTALAVWVARSGGELVGYVFGAPAIVNTAFSAAYSGSLPANLPVIVVCQGAGPAPHPQQAVDVNSQLARLIVDGLNRERISRGLPALGDASPLFIASAAYAPLLIQAGYLDHSLQGEPWDRARAAGYPTMNVGEIIASRTFSGPIVPASDAAQFARMWMESSPHRAIVLGELLNATEIGTGCANGRTAAGQTTIYCVGLTGHP